MSADVQSNQESVVRVIAAQKGSAQVEDDRKRRIAPFSKTPPKEANEAGADDQKAKDCSNIALYIRKASC